MNDSQVPPVVGKGEPGGTTWLVFRGPSLGKRTLPNWRRKRTPLQQQYSQIRIDRLSTPSLSVSFFHFPNQLVSYNQFKRDQMKERSSPCYVITYSLPPHEEPVISLRPGQNLQLAQLFWILTRMKGQKRQGGCPTHTYVGFMVRTSIAHSLPEKEPLDGKSESLNLLLLHLSLKP